MLTSLTNQDSIYINLILIQIGLERKEHAEKKLQYASMNPNWFRARGNLICWKKEDYSMYASIKNRTCWKKKIIVHTH